MQLSAIRDFIYNALAEDTTSIPKERLDAQIQSAFLWAVQAHDWPFLTVTIEEQPAEDLKSTSFRRVTQVFDTSTNTPIEFTSTQRALTIYSGAVASNPSVFTVNQTSDEAKAGVGIRFWPPPEDLTTGRFTVTGTLAPVAWPTTDSEDDDVPTLGDIDLPENLHFTIAYKAIAQLAQQEQIMDLAEFYLVEAATSLRDAKDAIVPSVNTRIVLGSDAVSPLSRFNRPRVGWR